MWQNIMKWLRWLLVLGDTMPRVSLYQPRATFDAMQEDWSARLLREAKEAEARLYDPLAFWLHPDRWEGIEQPNLKSKGGMAFWMIDREPRALTWDDVAVLVPADVGRPARWEPSGTYLVTASTGYYAQGSLARDAEGNIYFR